MIKYIEKGSGLHSLIQKSGYSLREENGVFISDHDEEIIQSLIDNYSLSDAAQYICDQIDQYAGTIRNKVTKGISPGEMSSWPLKVSEAQAIKAGGDPNDAKLLTTEATLRGVTVESIADRVLSNFEKLGSIEASIAGNCGFHKDKVRSQVSFEDISSYIQGGIDKLAGWPEI